MMCNVLVSVICVLVSLCLYKWYKKYKYLQQFNWLPTRKGLPIIGNALEFMNLDELLYTLIKLIPKKEKMLLLKMVGLPHLFVTDYDFIEFILSNSNILHKPTDYRFYEKWLGTGLLIGGGSKWKSRRRIIAPSFNFSILENFLEVFDSNGNIFINKLKKNIYNDKINIDRFVTLYALDVICESAMGVKVNAQINENSQYVQNVQLLCKIGMIRATSLIKKWDLLYLLTPDYYRELRAVKQLHEVTNAVIEERSLTCSSDEEDLNEYGLKKKMAFLDLLLNTRVDGKPLSHEDIREEVDTFMFAGHDTTAAAISFCVFFLSENPEVQEQAMEEQLAIFGNDKNRKSTLSDLQMMKYLECVIKETLRLCPSVPLYGRELKEDVYYKGNLLPKGLDIFIFPFGMHRDPDYYPNPEKFDPTRFENFDGKRPYMYIPFSLGPRNCVGQKFAMLEMKSVLSKLLRNFEILPTIPKHPMHFLSETVLKSTNGVQIRLKTRQW